MQSPTTTMTTSALGAVEHWRGNRFLILHTATAVLNAPATLCAVGVPGWLQKQMGMLATIEGSYLILLPDISSFLLLHTCCCNSNSWQKMLYYMAKIMTMVIVGDVSSLCSLHGN